jgi:hypothetical protein
VLANVGSLRFSDGTGEKEDEDIFKLSVGDR